MKKIKKKQIKNFEIQSYFVSSNNFSLLLGKISAENTKTYTIIKGPNNSKNHYCIATSGASNTTIHVPLGGDNLPIPNSPAYICQLSTSLYQNAICDQLTNSATYSADPDSYYPQDTVPQPGQEAVPSDEEPCEIKKEGEGFISSIGVDIDGMDDISLIEDEDDWPNVFEEEDIDEDEITLPWIPPKETPPIEEDLNEDNIDWLAGS